MALDESWFTEVDSPNGCAFSLKVNKVLHEEQTPFQHIMIYETVNFGRLLTLDNYVMLTDRDNFIYHEMMAHPVLFTHPNPKKVAIVGGGDCGTLREVLKHSSVEHVLQIEIDERVTQLAAEFFPALTTANDDARAEFYFDDGIEWMKNAPADSVDVIIVDSTDPIGPAEGLYNADFYQNCRRVLGETGLLVQQSESPLLHLQLLCSMHEEMRKGGFEQTQCMQFFQCVYPSGWWTATMAGQTDFQAFRQAEVDNRTFETLYYNLEMHHSSLAMQPFLRQALNC